VGPEDGREDGIEVGLEVDGLEAGVGPLPCPGFGALLCMPLGDKVGMLLEIEVLEGVLGPALGKELGEVVGPSVGPQDGREDGADVGEVV
jgi:hypothetical protein